MLHLCICAQRLGSQMLNLPAWWKSSPLTCLPTAVHLCPFLLALRDTSGSMVQSSCWEQCLQSKAEWNPLADYSLHADTRREDNFDFLPWPSFSFLPMKSNVFRPLTVSTVYIGVAPLQLSARDKHQIMSTKATSVSWFIAEGRQPSICDRLDRALPPSGVVSWFCLVGVWLPGWCIKV